MLNRVFNIGIIGIVLYLTFSLSRSIQVKCFAISFASLNQEIVQVLRDVGRGLLGDVGRVVQVIGCGLLGEIGCGVRVTRVSE